MALASERDPVQTVVDLLDATTNSDYTGSKPSIIERMQETERKLKLQKQSNALYVWKPAEGSIDQRAAGGSAYTESHTVQIEAWSPTSASKAYEIARDLQDHIFSTYAADNESSTNWHHIRPVATPDFRQEAGQDRHTQYRAALQVLLGNKRTP